MTVQHYKITAPEALFSGVVANVRFHQGVATLSVDPDAPRADGATRQPSDVTALAYFRRKGYTVEEVDSPSDVQFASGPVGTPNSRAALEAQVLGIPPGQQAEGAQQPPTTEPEKVGEQAEPAKLPAKSASKADWVDYAVNHGDMTRDDAEDMTRDQLAEKYTEASK